MKPKVFIARPIPSEVESYIAEHCSYTKWEERDMIPRKALLEKVAEADGLLTFGGRIDDELFDHAPNLKVVSTMSVGYNHFDLAAMKSRGIMGTHTPYVLDETVADLVLALMLGAARRIAELDRYVKEGSWQRGDDENLFGIDVHHAQVGIIGLGRIGEEIARRCKFGFNMDVAYYNRKRKTEAEEQFGVRYLPLDDLLQQSDFIVLMTPLTSDTTGLIGREQFKLMKSSAIFVNASRGQTIDEEALVEALQRKQIRAAGLDVYEKEPIDAAHPLLQLPNVITVPHIGSATARTRFNMAMMAARNLVMALHGEIPPNLVAELK
jgi:gluconate 2-dehydrogenase